VPIVCQPKKLTSFRASFGE